jgi:transposase InsO family protein
MVAFVNDHRDRFGVEPMCAVLPTAPSTYFRHHAVQADPTRRSARARRDEALCPEIRRVWEANFQVYGPRKVWKALRREGIRVARCTVRRLMRAMGLAGAVRGRAWITTTQPAAAPYRPSDLVERAFSCPYQKPGTSCRRCRSGPKVDTVPGQYVGSVRRSACRPPVLHSLTS